MTPHPSGWTVDTLKEFIDAQHAADERLRLEMDRRWTNDAELRANALKIKEVADEKALALAKEGQLYKDRQADQLRDETLGKSGIYATNVSVAAAIRELESNIFAAIKPLADFVAAQKGAKTATAEVGVKQLAWASLLVAAGVGIARMLVG